MERSVVEESRQGRATAHGEAAGEEHDGPRFSEQPTAITQPTGTISSDSHPASRTRRIAQPPRWFALAASLLAGIGVGGIGIQSLSSRSSAPEIVANPTRIIYDTMRGEVTPPRIEHADSHSPYVLVEVAVPPGAEHIVLKMARTSGAGYRIVGWIREFSRLRGRTLLPGPRRRSAMHGAAVPMSRRCNCSRSTSESPLSSSSAFRGVDAVPAGHHSTKRNGNVAPVTTFP